MALPLPGPGSWSTSWAWWGMAVSPSGASCWERPSWDSLSQGPQLASAFCLQLNERKTLQMGSHQPALPGTSCPAWGQVSEGRGLHGLRGASGDSGALWEWGWACMINLGRAFLPRAHPHPQVLLPGALRTPVTCGPVLPHCYLLWLGRCCLQTSRELPGGGLVAEATSWPPCDIAQPHRLSHLTV